MTKPAELFDLRKTKAALAEAEKTILCGVCHKIPKKAYSYICGHFFCHCCLNKERNECPTCKNPCNQKDIVIDYFAQNLINSVKEIAKLVEYKSAIFQDCDKDDATLKNDLKNANNCSSKQKESETFQKYGTNANGIKDACDIKDSKCDLEAPDISDIATRNRTTPETSSIIQDKKSSNVLEHAMLVNSGNNVIVISDDDEEQAIIQDLTECSQNKEMNDMTSNTENVTLVNTERETNIREKNQYAAKSDENDISEIKVSTSGDTNCFSSVTRKQKSLSTAKSNKVNGVEDVPVISVNTEITSPKNQRRSRSKRRCDEVENLKNPTLISDGFEKSLPKKLRQSRTGVKSDPVGISKHNTANDTVAECVALKTRSRSNSRVKSDLHANVNEAKKIPHKNLNNPKVKRKVVDDSEEVSHTVVESSPDIHKASSSDIYPSNVGSLVNNPNRSSKNHVPSPYNCKSDPKDISDDDTTNDDATNNETVKCVGLKNRSRSSSRVKSNVLVNVMDTTKKMLQKDLTNSKIKQKPVADSEKDSCDIESSRKIHRSPSLNMNSNEVDSLVSKLNKSSSKNHVSSHIEVKSAANYLIDASETTNNTNKFTNKTPKHSQAKIKLDAAKNLRDAAKPDKSEKSALTNFTNSACKRSGKNSSDTPDPTNIIMSTTSKSKVVLQKHQKNTPAKTLPDPTKGATHTTPKNSSRQTAMDVTPKSAQKNNTFVSNDTSVNKSAGKSKPAQSLDGNNTAVKSVCKTPKTVKTVKNKNQTPETPRRTPISPGVVQETPGSGNKQAKDLNKCNAKGETQLHLACIKGHADRVQKLLELQANPNIKDNAGWTPLHEAASRGYKDIVEMLLNAGAIVNVPGGENNITPLHDAVAHNKLDTVHLLLMYGADVTVKDAHGKTPRDYAENELMVGALSAVICIRKRLPVPVVVVCSSDITLCGCYMDKSQTSLLQSFAAQYDFKFTRDLNAAVSHVVMPITGKRTCTMSFGYLQAVLSGKWIVTFDWVLESNKNNKLMDFGMFEVTGTERFPESDAPKKARINAQSLLPALFNGFHVYFYGNNWTYSYEDMKLNISQLRRLIQVAGGVMLTREPDPEAIPPSENVVPYHAQSNTDLANCAHYIIYHPGVGEPLMKYRMRHVKSLPDDWLVTCMETFSLVECPE